MITAASGNNFPAAAVIDAVPGEQNTYSGEYTKAVALVGRKSAVDTVKRSSTASATRARLS